MTKSLKGDSLKALRGKELKADQQLSAEKALNSLSK